MIDIAHRDVDVRLSDLGEEQSRMLGRWFGSLPEADQPEVVYCSPYARAVQSAELLMSSAGLGGSAVRCIVDERLREKEFGILDRLTVRGIRERHPDHADQRAHVGKFYFRPPGARAGAT